MQLRRAALVGAGAVAALGLGILERTPGGRKVSRHVARKVTRFAKYESGRLEGVRYHLARRSPDPEAVDALLADRVRSMLGPLEHRLDIPRVHVSACGHDVMLHGDVDSWDQESELVRAARSVPGVHRVTSRLVVGLFAGDSRPSQGAAHAAESSGMRKVLSAVHGAGVSAGNERAAARSVLSTFVDLLPEGEREHVVGHFPADVRALVGASRSRPCRPIRRIDEFSVAALPLLPAEQRRTVVESVLGAVKELVPEEAEDVAAVLSEDLRQVWKTAMPL